MRIGILAVQGAFIEHEKMLEKLGIETVEIRQKKDILLPMEGIILPGGESTVMGKLLRELNMMEDLRDRINSGMPLLATCAGLILLAQHISGDETVHIGTLPITVRRNAYGRQLGSFMAKEYIKGIGEFPMTFIRAPYVEYAAPEVEVLARVEGKIVAVRYKNQMGIAFHPELTKDSRLHEEFVKMC